MTAVQWRVAAWAALIAVTVISLVPAPALPETGPQWTDKLVHAALYGVLMLLFSLGYRTRRPAPALFVLAVFLAAWGGVIELLQGMTAYRSASAFDALANFAGIITAAATRLYRRATTD